MSLTHRSSSPPPGLEVSGYQVLTRLGEGGMGVVHLARSPSGERVALKVIRPNVVGDDESRARLAREVNSLLRIRSRLVAEIIDADPWGDVPFVATRYVPGWSLHEQVAREGPLEGDDLVWFARCLARAIGAVHAVGVVHRDIKPSNILMEGRTPVLIDFGLARLADDPRLTAQGWLLGTPGYLAPEILHGQDASCASDIHSWAATVAYAGTGRAPFGSGPSAAVMDRVRRGEHVLTGLPDEVAEVVEAGLDPEPRNRPTVAAILTWLDLDESQEWEDDAELLPEDATVQVPLEPFPVTRPLTQYRPAQDRLTQHRPTSPPEVEESGDDPWHVDHWPSDGWPADGWHTVQDEAHDDEGYDDEGYDDEPGGVVDFTDDPWSVPTQAPPARVGLGVRLRRAVLLLCVGLAISLWFAAAPWVALASLTAAVWLLRTLSRTASAADERRQLRGAKWYDGVQSAASTPAHVFTSLPGTVALLLWASAWAAVVGLVLYTVLAPEETTWAGMGAGFALALWWGPGATRVRWTVSPLVRPFAAHPVVWFVVLLAALGGLAVGAAHVGSGPPPAPVDSLWGGS
ncbi:protein kinase [Nocardioides sp. Y6]|uniref:Protein kinase n=1 Tax=Nocardioides malaquae TaxID=2773426 RepID=A0ABR9RVB3_9ACTN|nr:bifunctional serine/threonine protein kinase/MFS transporter [Nocardioides malaquae]MBE7325050.1 protein kinase [Nocardioides malaquae]